METEEELIKGRAYTFIGDDESIDKNIYVMNQFLPKIKRECATFFSITGKSQDWIFCRTTIPKDGIVTIENYAIDVFKTIERKLVWPDEIDENLLEKEWIEEIRPIIEKTKYMLTKSYYKYFK